MPAGTIALTNGSNAVTGTGTSFTTELKQGDFIYVTVGSAPYTLVVSSVTSNTQLTLSIAFDGPTTSSLAWNAVPASMQVAITQKILNDFAQVARGRILDFQNWQKIYSSDQSVTVTRPDRTTFTGASWGYISAQFGSKANTADVLTKADNLASVADKSAARTNMGVAYGAAAGTVAQGNDTRLNTLNNKSGGVISSAITLNGYAADASGNYSNSFTYNSPQSAYNVVTQYWLLSGQYHSWRIVQNNTETFRANSNGACYAPSFNPTSDTNLKFNKKFLKTALSNALTLRGMSYSLQGERRAGIIAQDAEKFLPEAVNTNKTAVVLEDGTILKETKSLDYSAIAGLHTEALKDVVKLMLECLSDPESAMVKLTELVNQINTSNDDANETEMRMEWALVEQPAPPLGPELADSTELDVNDENDKNQSD